MSKLFFKFQTTSISFSFKVNFKSNISSANLISFIKSFKSTFWPEDNLDNSWKITFKSKLLFWTISNKTLTNGISILLAFKKASKKIVIEFKLPFIFASLMFK